MTSKYEHRFHIKCDNIRIHVVDETYDGEFMNLYYETDDDERVCVKDGMKIDVSLEIWNERGKRHFMNMTDESFDDIIYVTEQWIVENRHGMITDAKIRKAFREEIPGTTKLIIAQRISSIQDADRILVLDDGRINGFGTHEELLENNEIYRDVYESQTGGGNGDFDEKGDEE